MGDPSSAYTNRGLAWGDKGDLDRAIADYNEAIRLDPKYADAYYNRGLAWRAKGDLDRAIADYNEAIRLDPKYADAYNNRGNAWRAKGDLDRAIADYNRGDPARPEIRRRLQQPLLGARYCGPRPPAGFERLRRVVAPQAQRRAYDGQPRLRLFPA